MKELIAICLALVVVLSGLTAFGQTASGFDLTIQQLTEQIQAQIERIKLAREQADAQMSLARIRIAQQLTRAEEDLTRQVEQLEQLQEQLAQQVIQTDETAERLKNDIGVQLRNAVSQVAAQIKLTNELIVRLETLRDTVDDNPSAGSDPGQSWATPAGASTSPPVIQQPSPPPATVPPTVEQPTPQPDPAPPMSEPPPPLPAPEPSASPPSPAPATGST
jgi:TolA-binding protein